MDAEYISHLLYHLIVGDISDAGKKELADWAAQNDSNRKVYEHLQDPDFLQREYRRIKAVDPQRAMRDMRAHIEEESEKKDEEKTGKRKEERDLSQDNQERNHKSLSSNLKAQTSYSLLSTLRKPAVTILSAAALIAIVFGFYTYYNNVSAPVKPTTQIAQVASSQITHGSTQAVLTLENGDTIHLNGNNQAALNSKSSKLKAQSPKQTSPRLQLATPRGGEFKITLEDGTEVWLNAETQLQYPEAFGENERRVAVSGEAYFKVAKDAKRPFYVETAGQVVRVYGTEFNVHAYPEDKDVETTLVEGSIALQTAAGNGAQLMLTPGHQSSFDKQSHEAKVKAVDTEVVTSWRSGSFVFENQNLGEIMQTLSRWYDFDYTFADKSLSGTEFMGSIPRYGEFSDVIEILEASGDIKIRQKGRNVTISR